MKNTRIAAIVVGLLVLLPGLGLLIGGGGLGLVTAFGRDDSGYFTSQPLVVRSSSAVVTTEDLPVVVDPAVPAWVVDRLGVDIRLRATASDPTRTMFVGVSSTSDLDRYLSGVGHDVMTGSSTSPRYRSVPGAASVPPPAGQSFWAAAAHGSGMQELTWRPGNGHWSLVVANVDGSPGIAANVALGVRSDFLLPLTWLVLAAGVLLTLGGTLLVRRGVKRPVDRTGEVVPLAITESVGLGSQLTSVGTASRGRNQR